MTLKLPEGIRPYYHDEESGIVIYHGDVLSLLASMDGLMLDAIVADPPYSSGNLPESMKQKAGPRLRGWKWESKVMETDQLSTLGFIWLIREVLVEARLRMDEGASVLSFIDWRNWGQIVGAIESAGFRVNNMVVWDKQSIGMGNGFRNQHELIVYASKGTPRVVDRDVPNVLSFPRPSNEWHQSPKPLGLITDLMRVVSAKHDTILDPFLGSGTTAVAAKMLGRQCIGIELEERYCEIAAKRLDATPRPLFVDDPPEPEQLALEGAG